MTFETIIIVALVCIIAALIWHTLGIMDDRRRMQCALDKAHSLVPEDVWGKIVVAYDTALDEVAPESDVVRGAK